MTDPDHVWGALSRDPRVPGQAQMRASDADRDLVLGVLTEAYADGRITREDVDRFVEMATVSHVGEIATAQPRHFNGADVPHDRMRLKIAENMVRAVSEAPHVTALFEADFSAIAAHK